MTMEGEGVWVEWRREMLNAWREGQRGCPSRLHPWEFPREEERVMGLFVKSSQGNK